MMKCQKKMYIILAYLYNYWFCYENEKNELSTVYLEECKYKIKKIKMCKFINPELESESELESDTELESVRIWFWIVAFFLPSLLSTLYCLCFKQCIDGCLFDCCQFTLNKSKKIIILLTLNKCWLKKVSFYFPDFG